MKVAFLKIQGISSKLLFGFAILALYYGLHNWPRITGLVSILCFSAQLGFIIIKCTYKVRIAHLDLKKSDRRLISRISQIDPIEKA